MSAAPVAEASAAPADNGEPVQLQFEEEAEQGLGPDAAVPDPPSSPWVRRKKRQTAVPEQAKASDALAAKGTGGPGTCLLCQKKCYNKSKFCNDRKKDAEACRRDAESSGQIAFFNEQCNSTELLRKMLVEYISKWASKGPGVKRDRFDWVQYQEKLYSGKEVRKGSKDRPLCYQQWMKHAQEQEFKSWQLVFNLNTSHVVFSTEHVVKGVDWVLARHEAHADWQRFEADEDVQRDQLGPQASPLRLYCPVEDYVIHEDVSGYRRQRVAATKSKSKPQDKDIKAMDESLQGSMPKWNDERFNIGDFRSGTANPYLTQGGHDATVSRVVQDVPTLSGSGRSEGTPGPSPQSGTAPVKPSKDIAKQKTKKYDEALNSLQKEQRNWLQVLNKSQATIEEFVKDNERADYEHFLCLAETRLLAMQWLLKEDMTREALDKKWGLLQDEPRLYLPCDTALLRLPSEIMTKVKHILLANNVEDLHSKKDLATADITQISQLSRGLSGSAPGPHQGEGTAGQGGREPGGPGEEKAGAQGHQGREEIQAATSEECCPRAAGCQAGSAQGGQVGRVMLPRSCRAQVCGRHRESGRPPALRRQSCWQAQCPVVRLDHELKVCASDEEFPGCLQDNDGNQSNGPGTVRLLACRAAGAPQRWNALLRKVQHLCRDRHWAIWQQCQHVGQCGEHELRGHGV